MQLDPSGTISVGYGFKLLNVLNLIISFLFSLKKQYTFFTIHYYDGCLHVDVAYAPTPPPHKSHKFSDIGCFGAWIKFGSRMSIILD
jgi:hypothetical protein